MAIVASFLVREIFTRNMTPHVNSELDGTHAASHFVNCVNAQTAATNPTMETQVGRPHTARVIAQDEDLAVLTGGRDIRGRWIVVVDFREGVPKVYDIRNVAASPSVTLQHGISNFGTTSAFRACGGEYMGPVPVPPRDWADWFGDAFFLQYPQWNTYR